MDAILSSREFVAAWYIFLLFVLAFFISLVILAIGKIRSKFFILLLPLFFASDVFGASVTWVCGRCNPTSGTAEGTTNWQEAVPGIQLAIGVNIITVTATDDNLQTATDTITITYAPTFPGNTMAGAWGFGEGSGTAAADSSGNNNNGTLRNGAVFTGQGHSGQGITFNGTTSDVLVGNATSLQYTQSFSFSAWVNPSSLGGWKSVISKNGIGGLYASSDSPCQSSVPSMWFVTNGGFYPDNEFYACGPTPLPLNQWSHLQGTYDGSNVRLYVNGALVTTLAVSGYIDYVAANMTLQIGSSRFNEYFAGVLDEVRTANFAAPLTAGSNTVWGAACGYANYTTTVQATPGPVPPTLMSVTGDGNCPVVPGTPPITVKFPATATGLKVGAGATFKVGQP